MPFKIPTVHTVQESCPFQLVYKNSRKKRYICDQKRVLWGNANKI